MMRIKIHYNMWIVMFSNIIVYVATKMTGRDRKEQIKRAKLVKVVFEQYGIQVISPVIEEKVSNEEGPLVQTSIKQLHDFWKQDKRIICYQAHVVFFDEAERKS